MLLFFLNFFLAFPGILVVLDQLCNRSLPLLHTELSVPDLNICFMVQL